MIVIKGYIGGWPKFSITFGSKKDPDESVDNANKILKLYGYRIEKISKGD
jgi:hypothetical protein